jgi:hypothetical protein
MRWWWELASKEDSCRVQLQGASCVVAFLLLVGVLEGCSGAEKLHGGGSAHLVRGIRWGRCCQHQLSE